MKKLIFIITCTLAFNLNAQDGYNLDLSTYKAIYSNINQLDSISAAAFANDLSKASKTDYEFVKAKSKSGGDQITFYYLDATLSPSGKTKALEFGCKPCLKVNFKAFKDRLKFHSVIGSLDDLLPTWIAVFLKTANAQNVGSSFKFREVKNTAIGLDVRFTKTQNLWSIYNWSI